MQPPSIIRLVSSPPPPSVPNTASAIVHWTSDNAFPVQSVAGYLTGSGVSITEIALAPSVPGNFTVAHGLGTTPTLVLIQMTSGGAIWFQTTRYDGTNIYLVASDGGITGNAIAFS